MLTYQRSCDKTEKDSNCLRGNIGRDLNAVRNMVYITKETIRTGDRPVAFRRTGCNKFDLGLSDNDTNQMTDSEPDQVPTEGHRRCLRQ